MADTITVTINERKISVPAGTTILEAARQCHIHIPTLCHHDDLCLSGICRICVVEVEGEKILQAACSAPITRPITVRTHTEKVRKARRNILELMLANHYGECFSCFRNKNCELQDLAKEYGVDELRFEHVSEPVHAIDTSSKSVVRDMNKCILCRRCIRTCQDFQGVGALEAANRGIDTEIQTFLDHPLGDAICINCGQCINRCPTGALREKDRTAEVWEALDNPQKVVVIQTAPAPRAAIGEEFGLPPGTSVTKKLNTALKMVGFDYVFDTNFAADLTIMEEGTELLTRLKKTIVDGEQVPMPMLTSCSPGWVKYCEHYYPELLQNLSTCKSPQQMFGALIKTYFAQKQGIDPSTIVSVSLMPCVAKKYEADRPEMMASGFRDVDYALTSRELAQMIQQTGVKITDLDDSPFDDPMGIGSGAGLIFGATGGVMEAAIRTAYEIVTGEEVPFENLNIMPVRGMSGVKEAELFIPHAVDAWKFLEGKTVRVAIAHGTANAKKIMDIVQRGEAQWHFVEIMACPGGCLGGGGQPVPTNETIREARARAIYAEDESLGLRKSHLNPQVIQLYTDFLGEPLGHRSHELLHTTYTPRGTY